MALAKKLVATCSALILLSGMLCPGPAYAMSIKKEKELSLEFKQMVFSSVYVIKESLIADYVNAVGRRILSNLPAQPFPYRFYVIRDDTYNAFAGPAGLIFVHSGLLAAMESEEELAGILAHEIAHGVHRHLADRAGQTLTASLATLAAVAAGLLLGASGAGMPAEAVVIGALSAGQGLSFAYSREAEEQADKSSLAYLEAAGYSADGLQVILRKMREKQWFGPQDTPTYLTSHPGTEERMAYIASHADTSLEKGGKVHRVDPDAFRWMHTKLVAMYGEEEAALRRFETQVKAQPESALAHYGYGLALARKEDYKEAVVQIRSALDRAAFNPHILIELGRIYFDMGQFDEASKILKGAARLSPNYVDRLYYLGRTQMAIGEYADAVSSFSAIIDQDKDIEEAFYHLGESYGKLGNMAKAHFNLGIYNRKIGNLKNALFHLERAVEASEDPEEKKQMEKMLDELKKEQKKTLSERRGRTP